MSTYVTFVLYLFESSLMGKKLMVVGLLSKTYLRKHLHNKFHLYPINIYTKS